MILHPNLEGAVREFFAGIRSLGVVGQLGSFAFGWAFGWFVLVVRRKLKIG